MVHPLDEKGVNQFIHYHFIFQFQDINSPTDSVIGRDFQELSAEEQERQREEWKAELKKTEEEILTLKQVLTAKERHAAGGQQ